MFEITRYQEMNFFWCMLYRQFFDKCVSHTVSYFSIVYVTPRLFSDMLHNCIKFNKIYPRHISLQIMHFSNFAQKHMLKKMLNFYFFTLPIRTQARLEKVQYMH